MLENLIESNLDWMTLLTAASSHLKCCARHMRLGDFFIGKSLIVCLDPKVIMFCVSSDSIEHVI